MPLQTKVNPLHTEYGIFNNICFILGKIRRYCPVLLLFMVVGMISRSVTQYLWTFIGKYVIDLIQVRPPAPPMIPRLSFVSWPAWR